MSKAACSASTPRRRRPTLSGSNTTWAGPPTPSPTATAGGRPSRTALVSGTFVLKGVACPSATTCYAVGFNSSSAGVVVPIVNGTPGPVQSVSGTAELLGVACPSATTCYAVGIDSSGSAGVVATISSQVAQAPQTISFTSSPPANPTVGGGYTASATGGASGNPEVFSADASSTSGACTVSATGAVTFTGVGTCVIDANQAGNANFTAPDQVQQTLSIAQAPTTTVLTQSPSSSSFGQPVTLTATVSATPGAGTPTGTVTFTDGTTTLGTVPLNANGQASLTTELGAGPHTVVATYSGAPNFAPSASSAQGSTLTVGCTQTITGNHPGSIVVSSGSTCLVNANVTGSVVVQPGAALDVEGSTVSGSISAQGPSALRVCAIYLGGSLSSTGAKGFVLIGGDGDDNCAPNTIAGSLVLRNNTGSLEAIAIP